MYQYVLGAEICATMTGQQARRLCEILDEDAQREMPSILMELSATLARCSNDGTRPRRRQYAAHTNRPKHPKICHCNQTSPAIHHAKETATITAFSSDPVFAPCERPTSHYASGAILSFKSTPSLRRSALTQGRFLRPRATYTRHLMHALATC